MAKLFIEDIDVSNKTVITRVDFNVPLNQGVVENDKRLRASLPTIQYLVKQGAKVVLMSHLGRPDGERVASMSLEPVAARLAELLGQDVKFASDCIGEPAQTAVNGLQPGEVLVLENLRYHAAETDNDEGFAKALAGLADVYVNDAFGAAHRAHASTAGITQFIDVAACGYLLKKELDFLGDAVENPSRPFVAIIGGSKISGKIDVIEALLPKVDHLIIGGGMSYTFFKAMGLEIGQSLCEDAKVPLAKELIERAGDKLVLPIDCVVTDRLDFNNRTLGTTEVVGYDQIPADKESVDCGPASVQKFGDIIRAAKTVIWNGPVGVFEIEASSKGTFGVADALAEATAAGTISIIGGGDSAAAVEKAGLEDKVTHVSTGGGASLEFLEGKKLPGVEALNDK